jgi:hypothetical protein
MLESCDFQHRYITPVNNQCLKLLDIQIEKLFSGLLLF